MQGEMNETCTGRAWDGGAAKGRRGLEPVAKCREHSKSIWIHFPHVELVFLLYAAQGSFATQLGALRHDVGVIFVVAAIALVSTKNADIAKSSAIFLCLAATLRPLGGKGSGGSRACIVVKGEDENLNGGAPRDRNRSPNKSCHRRVLLFGALALV